MEIRTDDGDRIDVLIAVGDAFWIGVGDKFAGDLETGAASGGADQVCFRIIRNSSKAMC